MSNQEPFGYFRADACGWTDCHDDDDGAIPLWDNAAMCAVEKQRDELLAALDHVASVAKSTHDLWDRDQEMKVGKYLMALSGYLKGYDARTDAIHTAIASAKGGAV